MNWSWTWGGALSAAAVAGMFLYEARQPIWHTDVWGHLAYGRVIWQMGSIPEREPFLMHAADAPFIDPPWLSQVVAYAVTSTLGIAGLQCLYAAAVAMIVGSFGGMVLRRTGNMAWTWLAAAVFVWVQWQHLKIIRPQLAGLLCSLMILQVATSRRFGVSQWIAVVVVFALWANLHGSFPVGLLMLGASAAGRTADLLRRDRRFAFVVRDSRLRHLLGLTVAAACAVCMNPYGPNLYEAVWHIARHPNVADLVEWQPLTLRMRQGRAAAALALGLCIAYRFSPRRSRCHEWLLLFGFGAAMLWSSRMIVWWGGPAAYLLAVHGTASWRRFRKLPMHSETKRRSPIAATFAAIAIVLCGAASPLGVPWLSQSIAGNRAALSAQTPVAAVAHLHETAFAGPIFNALEWGDYLIWAGPRDVRVFAASHVHLLPREIWRDYMRVVRLDPGWQNVLRQHRIELLLLDRARQRGLVQQLRHSADWTVTYEDRLAVIFERDGAGR